MAKEIIKYSDIRSIIAEMQYWQGKALLWESGGEVEGYTWRQLAERVIDRANGLPGYAEPVTCDGRPETVVRILADIFAGRDILLTGPDVPPMTAEGAARMLEYRELGFYQSHSAVCFFTSGTTGMPHIVVLTQRSLAECAWSGQCMLQCGPGDVILAGLPLSHVFGFVCSLLWGLAYGATVALGRGFAGIADDLALFRPTILPTVPAIIDPLSHTQALNAELKTVLIGGASPEPGTVDALRSQGKQVYIGYGLTETASGVAITQDQDEPYALYPCPGVDIRIEDDGEISVETPCIMEGYLGEPEMMEARLLTGDLGRMDDRGRLFVTGRKDKTGAASWKTGRA